MGDKRAMGNDTTIELNPVIDLELSRQRILLVDDDHEQAETLAFSLRRQGFEVMTAHSARAAMAAIELHQPQLVILDIRLPDGNGLELCQQLTDDADTCDIPVIILSGMEGADIVRRARAAGCQYFLRKPYDPNALLLLAESAINH